MRVANVVIIFKNGLENEQVGDFINQKLRDVKILEIKGNQVTLLWELGEHDGLNDIDEDLYYVLNDEEIGDHTCFYV